MRASLQWVCLCAVMATSLACETPWELVETGTLSDNFISAARTPQGAYVFGSDQGRILRGTPESGFTDAPIIDPDGAVLRNKSTSGGGESFAIHGLTVLGTNGDVYGW